MQTNQLNIIDLEIYTDGACRGNHKHISDNKMSSAFLVFRLNSNNKRELCHKWSKYLGNGTNNIAEYTAIIEALKYMYTISTKNKFCDFNVKLFSDSEVAIKQINGHYKCNDDQLQKCLKEVNKIRVKLGNIDFCNVLRTNTYIKKADKLCNMILNNQQNLNKKF